ncbi:hypothetical protein DKX38_001012 [Salix brachista]|uniref:Apple domain-containing protein n=1 Tax=Salix brachista TaxID=2182728 RepID=A0A5N5P3Q3_9ROSI|nr:hypothetical protein DKX38_001012 [Salix brachista]
MHAMTKWSFCLSLLLCILNIRTCSSNGSDTLSAGQSRRYWSSGVWSGQGFSSIPEMRVNIYNFSVISNENESYFTYSMSNTSILSRFVMDTSGKMMQWLWLAGSSQWFLYWSQPTDQADVYAFCGAFGVFSESTTSPCNCIKGFKPFRQNDWSSGCVRESPLQCQKKEGNGKKDEFLRMSNLTLPTNSKTHESANATRCELDCLESCSCTAFAYNNSGCFVWEGDLVNLQQLVEAGVSRAGADIYIKLAAAEFQYFLFIQQIGNKRRIRAILAVVIPVTFITFGLLIYCCYLRKRKLPHKGEEDTSENLLLFDFDNDPNSTNNVSNSVDNRRKNAELPLFSYESVSAAWKSWNSRRALDMMDPVLGNPPSTSVLLRHINIGLLCVQESPADRPTMSDVFSMIVNENAPLPAPKQPAFATGRNMGDTSSSMSSAGLPSVNNLTVTMMDAR